MINVPKTKVWLFYYTGDDEIWGTFPNELYAYTLDWKLAALFTEQRNMDIFSMKVVKCNKDELNKLYREHMRLILSDQRFSTKGKNNKLKHIDTVVTSREYDLIRSQSSLYTNEYLMENTNVNPFIFKDKYRRALAALQYITLYLYLKNSNDIVPDSDVELVPDMIEVMIDNFSEVFLKEGG